MSLEKVLCGRYPVIANDRLNVSSIRARTGGSTAERERERERGREGGSERDK